MIKKKKWKKWGLVVLLTPLALFFLLAILLYIPAFQNFVVKQVTERVSTSTGMQVHIGRVALAFPLDLVVHDALVVDERDTLLDARSLRVDVQLFPLLKGVVNVDAITLNRVRLNTASLISDTQVRGTVGRLFLSSHGVDLGAETVLVDRAELSDAQVHVALSDTARKDTTTSAVKWLIQVDRLNVQRTDVSIQMPGDSMCIGVDAHSMELRDGVVDLGAGHYTVGRFLWTGGASYDLPYEAVQEGLDYNHLHLSGIQLQVDTLHFSAERFSAGLKGLRFAERSGFEVSQLRGGVMTDSARLVVQSLMLRTPHSSMDVVARMDWTALKQGGLGTLRAEAGVSLGRADLLLLAGGIPADLRRNWPEGALDVTLKADGNESDWHLTQCDAAWKGVFNLKAKGQAASLTDSLLRNGKVDLTLQTRNLNFVRVLMGTDAAARFALPSDMLLGGWLRFKGMAYETNLDLKTQGGTLGLGGRYHMGTDAYSVRLKAQNFPIQAFMPSDSLFDFSGYVALQGRGFDFLAPSTSLQGEVAIDKFRYTTLNLDSIRLNAQLRRGVGEVEFASNNEVLAGSGTVKAHLSHRKVSADYDLLLDRLNVQKLSGGRDTMNLSLRLAGNGYTDMKVSDYGIKGGFTQIYIGGRSKRFPTKDLLFDIFSRKDSTFAQIQAGDLELRLNAGSGVDWWTGCWMRFLDLFKAQLEQKRLDQNALKALLPGMKLHMSMSSDNPVMNFLKYRGYTLNNLHLDFYTDPTTGVNGHGYIYGLNTGAILLDTVRLNMYQDTTGVQTKIYVRNATKRNPHRFEARLESYLLSDGAGLEVYFRDQDGREGVNLGVRADLIGSDGIRLQLYPRNPVLAFRRFTVNEDNYIYVNRADTVQANIDLLADDGTAVRLYSTPQDSTIDLTLSVSKLNLGELTALFPYVPSISGFMDADVHLVKQQENMSVGVNTNVKDMAYEQTLLGNIGLDMVYLPEADGRHYVNGNVVRNNAEVMVIDGFYKDEDGGTLDANLEMTRFPLDLLNGFMGEVIGLSGYAAGSLAVSGSASAPLMDGELKLDSAHLYSAPYGFDFVMEDRALSIAGSKLKFDDYKFLSKRTEPLVIAGEIDFSQLDKVRLDLLMKAHNFELINSPRTEQSLVFGKVYTDYEGTLRGTPDYLKLRGMLTILDRTDVTYILKDTPLSVDDRLSDLVQFVDFTDSVNVEKERPSLLGLDMTLGISISDAARVHCELSSDGESYVNIEGGGDLTMKYTPQGELSLVGRYTAISGEMKYELPVIPLKTFNIVSGSYVDFTGDAMNPTLNITAKERVKASVTENEVSRSVAFDVGISITKPLSQMGLEFTLEAPDDQTVQNQLAAMSREQRAKLAVSMLATGMYLIEGNSGGTPFNTNNALNAFLQSEIQNIAGSALKTIDMSLSVEDGTSADGTTTTDYSFRFAKRFWGNRVNVIVGGKVSTGQDAENNAESFIDNISLEYRLDKSATRYVRLFYDRNTRDPLEGQLVETGAGLVLRRKTDNLGELFIFRSNRKKTKSKK